MQVETFSIFCCNLNRDWEREHKRQANLSDYTHKHTGRQRKKDNNAYIQDSINSFAWYYLKCTQQPHTHFASQIPKVVWGIVQSIARVLELSPKIDAKSIEEWKNTDLNHVCVCWVWKNLSTRLSCWDLKKFVRKLSDPTSICFCFVSRCVSRSREGGRERMIRNLWPSEHVVPQCRASNSNWHLKDSKTKKNLAFNFLMKLGIFPKMIYIHK